MIEDWWGVKTKAVYRVSLEAVGGDADVLDYGPAHVVWADDNFEDESIQFCLGECETRRQEWLDKFGEAKLDAVRTSLELLLKIPEDERGDDPQDYGDDDQSSPDAEG